MCSSTPPSHVSTLPRALRFLPSITFSPSPEYMAKMSIEPGWLPKSSFLMLSKHLIRCGCTACGLRASAKISSSSSFERKKKRGKAERFVSR
eukprot:6586981-Prymnesium_polylepis.1